MSCKKENTCTAYENPNALPKTPSEEKVLEALRTLSQVCESNDCECSKCLLRTQDDACGLFVCSDGDDVENPTYWNIYSEDKPKRLLLH